MIGRIALSHPNMDGYKKHDSRSTTATVTTETGGKEVDLKISLHPLKQKHDYRYGIKKHEVITSYMFKHKRERKPSTFTTPFYPWLV